MVHLRNRSIVLFKKHSTDYFELYKIYTLKMYCEKALTLVKDYHRNCDNLPAYNAELIREISQEIIQLIRENQNDCRFNESTTDQSYSYISTVKIRHIAIQRNIRCLLAYQYNRLKKLRQMRWEFGSALPQSIRSNLSAEELKWFTKYSRILATYMRSIGENDGLNLTLNLKPPKTLCIEVSCLTNYGNLELSNGIVVNLKKGSRHFLPRTECEELIRQGILKHIE